MLIRTMNEILTHNARRLGDVAVFINQKFKNILKMNSENKDEVTPSSGNIANAVLAAAFRPLKQKQIYQLTEGKKHWSEKKQHLIKVAKNFGITISTDEELKYLIEIHCPNEERRIKKQFFIDSQTGKRKTHLTPTDVKGDFTKITRPVIGVKYHISWAFSGAVFKLVKVEGDTCYLDNPKYKRDTLLKCKVSELRGLR